MSDTHPFQFLDLPKEIRLMVYERLPTKVTHYRLGTHVAGRGKDNLPAFTWTTLCGINILATCVQINGEASAVLAPRLTAIKQYPVRIIADQDTLDSDRIENILQCLSAGSKDCSRVKDLRKATPSLAHHHADHTLENIPAAHTAERQVVVALQVREKRRGHFHNAVMRLDLKVDMFHFRIGYTLAMGARHKTRLNVVMRPALPSQAAKETLDWTMTRDGLSSYGLKDNIRFGVCENISEDEWEKDWAEGER